jgi:hypothetical protein
MGNHVLEVFEDNARVQERLEIEDVVVGSDRRPHVFLIQSRSRRGQAEVRRTVR